MGGKTNRGFQDVSHIKESSRKANDTFLHKVVLIDDDPVFCKLLSAQAQNFSVHLDYFASLESMSSIGNLRNYACAIVDYDLGGMTGVEIGEYLQHLFRDLPMVLISQTERSPGLSGWPNSIKGFVSKSDGADIFKALYHFGLLGEPLKLTS